MKEINIVEKPDTISWEDIRQHIVEAHKKNIEKGLVVKSTTLSSEQLRSQVSDGKCFVALDGDKLVGVAAVRIKSCSQWFCHGNVAHFLLDSVSTNYQGLGVYSLLQKKRYDYVKEQGVSIITTNTAANNERMIKMLPQHDFHRVLLFRAPNTDHFSITWARWLYDRPSEIKRWINYEKSVLKNKLKYVISIR